MALVKRLCSVIAGLQNFPKGKIEILPKNKNFSCEFLATEKNGMFPSLSALDNLQFWCKLNGQNFSPDELMKAADQWGQNTFSLTQIPIKKFSTGMKRKIALLKVFLSPAKILLFDEPMNGLDQKSSEYFIESLMEAKSRGKIILISSHHNSSLYQKAVDHTLELSKRRVL